ncbi:DUF4062 domain-containing protein [Microbacterium ulmi]|uniref:DUF4062 domain-containing protein n=1 Tax=Microbacterium ulmi TaxID=179095 RepID=A0A7Y2LXD7_9MICO|nr:DUF4062 domain-containing protein [Microbacterium ulmi]NII71277.1 hypothetical protein [Microbacterium ulmi]NNH02581.1 DUF4062 domain-containing protein [Microbacterium ulmi]
MTSSATVLYVMIASPGDVSDGREAALRAISSWNESNARTRSVVVVPLRWESVVPQAGDHPQAIINAALLDNADALVGIFGSRIGTATPTAISGTVEEIDRAVADGKRVHLWFSTAPHPNDVDIEQLAALRQFRDDLARRSLYGTYANADELIAKVWAAIDSDIEALGIGGPLDPAPALAGVKLIVQSGSENIPEQDSRGRLKTRVRRFIDVKNEGGIDAESLTARAGDRQANLLYEGDRPRTLHAGQLQRFRYDLSIADGVPTNVLVKWTEEGEPRERLFDV